MGLKMGRKTTVLLGFLIVLRKCYKRLADFPLALQSDDMDFADRIIRKHLMSELECETCAGAGKELSAQAGARLKEFRRKERMNQSDLALAMVKSRQYVGLLESGDRPLTVELARSYLKSLYKGRYQDEDSE